MHMWRGGNAHVEVGCDSTQGWGWERERVTGAWAIPRSVVGAVRGEVDISEVI